MIKSVKANDCFLFCIIEITAISINKHILLADSILRNKVRNGLLCQKK